MRKTEIPIGAVSRVTQADLDGVPMATGCISGERIVIVGEWYDFAGSPHCDGYKSYFNGNHVGAFMPATVTNRNPAARALLGGE